MSVDSVGAPDRSAGRRRLGRPRHGLRWSGALLAGAAVLAVGLYLGSPHPSAGAVTQAMIIALLAAAAVLAIGGLTAPQRPRPPIEAGSGIALRLRALLPLRARTASALQLAALLIIVGAATLLTPWPGLIGGLGAGLALLLIMLVDRSPPPGRTSAIRIVVAVLFAVLTPAAVIFDVFHLMVWNPLAKVPGQTLDEIYAALAAAGEAQVVPGFLVAWAIFWCLPALLFPIFVRLTGLELRFTFLVGLLLVGGAILTGWYAAFGMGMGMADTFVTDGGDASLPSGTALHLIGQTALAAAVIIALAPVGPRSHRG